MFVKLDGPGTLYQQLYQALRGAILAGQLAPGERLPATRPFVSGRTPGVLGSRLLTGGSSPVATLAASEGGSLNARAAGAAGLS